MAEYAAHVTAASLSVRPSIFEILAQDGLNRIIQPAVKHASRILAEQNPEKYGWMLKYFDEMYAGMDFLIENYYLYKYAGSFAENFYGMRRIGQLPLRQLTQSVYWKSIFFLVAFPYIKEKWKKSYEQFRENTLKPASHSTIKIHPLKKIPLSLFPYVNSFWEVLVLFFEMSYIFHRSEWASPSLYLAGARLTAISPEVKFPPTTRDLPSVNLLSPILFSSSFPRQVAHLCLQLLNFISFGLSTGLSIGVFFLQFLDYWYNTLHSINSPIALTMQPIPKKPKPYPLSPGYSFSTCPLCMKTRTNDTVLCVSGTEFTFFSHLSMTFTILTISSSHLKCYSKPIIPHHNYFTNSYVNNLTLGDQSGPFDTCVYSFVFCYPCIYDHVNVYHCCPVTKYPANVQHLVRIFSSES